MEPALILAILGVAFDGLIFAWLVFTWFWAGDHRRCKVEVQCPLCGAQAEQACTACRKPQDAGTR